MSAFIEMSQKILKIAALPLSIIFSGVVFLYKFLISPLLPKCCIYYPSCSTYMLLAIKEFGPFGGVVLGIKRIMRCTPWHKGGYDPLPHNIKGDLKWLI